MLNLLRRHCYRDSIIDKNHSSKAKKGGREKGLNQSYISKFFFSCFVSSYLSPSIIFGILPKHLREIYSRSLKEEKFNFFFVNHPISHVRGSSKKLQSTKNKEFFSGDF